MSAREQQQPDNTRGAPHLTGLEKSGLCKLTPCVYLPRSTLPFFKTVAIYFVLYIPVERPSLFAAVIKCLPIVSLVIFVLLHGMSLADEYAFSRRILSGLILSCIGDALLVWPEYFLHGMAAFGVAHVLYTYAFGFKPFNAALGVILYALCAVAIAVFMPGLSGELAIGVPLYTFLLVTTVWRAIARVQLFEELWTWTKLCSCAGGIMFAVSDGLIGIHHFYHPVPYSQTLIMVTYYAAQLGIALSVVDSKADFNAKRDAELLLETERELRETERELRETEREEREHLRETEITERQAQLREDRLPQECN